MFNFFKLSSRVEDLENAFAQLKKEMNVYKDDFEKLEIKALESRKIYGKKLKQFVEREEESSKEEEKASNSPLLAI